MLRLLVALAVVTLTVGLRPPLASAQSKTGFVTKTHANADGSKSDYVVFVPKKSDGTKPVPVILFLHGAGETKGGAKMPVEQGLGTYINKNADTFEYLTIIPHAEATKQAARGRWGAGSPDSDRALAMLDATTKEYKTDPNRVILTGLSMGGYGTWSNAAAHAGKWAAIVPI